MKLLEVALIVLRLKYNKQSKGSHIRLKFRSRQSRRWRRNQLSFPSKSSKVVLAKHRLLRSQRRPSQVTRLKMLRERRKKLSQPSYRLNKKQRQSRRNWLQSLRSRTRHLLSHRLNSKAARSKKKKQKKKKKKI